MEPTPTLDENVTRRPWAVLKPVYGKYPSIVSPSGDAELGTWMVAERVRWTANAAFIVKACNSHDRLVAALRNLLDRYVQAIGNEGPECYAARAALATAEAQP